MQRVNRLVILIALLALVFSAQTLHPVQAAGTWETVGPASLGNGDAYELSFAIDNGVPYVAYIGTFNNTDSLFVRKFNGTDWIGIGNKYVSPRNIHNLSLDVEDQIPFVAYTDRDNKPTVLKFNGTAWEVVGVEGFSDGGIYNLSPIVVDNGVPYVAYVDMDQGLNYVVKKFDGTSWVNVGETGVSTNDFRGSSLAIDNGVLYLAFNDSSPQAKVTVIKFNGTNWVTVGSSGFAPREFIGHTSLAIENGIPFVAYSAFGEAGKATVMKFNGIDWVTVGAPGFSAGIAYDITIEVYNGLPYVAFLDSAQGSEATVMKFNGSNWVAVGQPGFSNQVAVKIDLELLNGVPEVAFSGGDSIKVTVMKFNSSTNAPPTDIAISNDHVPQNLPVGTTIGTLTAIDADLGDTHVYALNCAAPGPDDASFKIGGTGNDQLQTNAVFDYNTKNAYDICVQTDDGSEGVYEKNLTIHVTTVVPSKMGFRGIGVNDGWILEYNYSRGGLVNTADAVLRVGDNELNREYRSILSFNTINLPDNAIIFRVTLKIKRQTIVGTDPFSDMGKLMVDIRAPYFGASAALVKTDFQATSDMNIGDIPNHPVSDWYRKVWSSDPFFALINPTGRTQFRLYFANGNNWNDTADTIDFNSGNYSTITDRPMLIIEYYVP